MVSFKFQGFSQSSSVALTVTQNGISRSGDIPAWNVTAGGMVSIEVDAPTNPVAPTNIWLRAVGHSGLAAPLYNVGSYDATHHELFHVWTINGQPLSAFQAPENMVSQWKNPNLAYGREVAFCLPQGGDYVIDLWVVDRNGVTASASTSTVSVIASDDAFPGISTKVVALDGDFTDAPPGAQQYTSFADMYATLSGSTAETRVLFKRGETYTGDEIKLLNSSRYVGQLGAWGTGPRPIIDQTNISMKGSFPAQDQISFWGLEFKQGYDPTTERGRGNVNGMIDLLQLIPLDLFVTMYDLKLEGSNTGLTFGRGSGAGTADNGRFMVADCIIDGFRNYAVYSQSLDESKMALVGNRLTQKVDALNGGPKGNGFGNIHGPIRLAELQRVYISQNDIFSRTGWTGLDQPCLRLFVNKAPGDEVGTIERNVMEGGYQVLNLLVADGSVATPYNVLIERNLLIASPMTVEAFIAGWRGGVTVRGNYLYVPPSQLFPSNSGSDFIAFSDNAAGGSSADNRDHPIQIYNNTMYSRRTAAQEASAPRSGVTNAGSDYTEFTEEYNLLHQPDALNAVDAGNVTTAGNFSGITTRFKGIRWGFKAETGPNLPSAGVADGASFTIPYSMLTQELQNGSSLGDNTTDQTYWQGLAGTDTDHELLLQSENLYLYAAEGDFTVSFGTSEVTITNTSGADWPGNATTKVHLDRTSFIPAMDTSFASDNQAVALLKPEAAPVSGLPAAVIHMPIDLLGNDHTVPKVFGALAHTATP